MWVYILILVLFTTILIFPNKCIYGFIPTILICFHFFSLNSKYNKYFSISSILLISLSCICIIIFSLNYPNLMPSSEYSISYNFTFIIIRFILMYLITCIIFKKMKNVSITNLCIIFIINISVIYNYPIISYIVSCIGINLPNIYCLDKDKCFYEPRYQHNRTEARSTPINSLFEITLYRANYLYHNQNSALKQIYLDLIRKLAQNIWYNHYTIDEISLAVMHGAEVKESMQPPFVFPEEVTLLSICEGYFKVPNNNPHPNFFLEKDRYYVQDSDRFERMTLNMPIHHPFKIAQDMSSIQYGYFGSRTREMFLMNTTVPEGNRGITLDSPATRVNRGQQLPTGPTWRAIVNSGLYPFKGKRPWEL